MRLLLVVDANVIIAAILRDSTTRRILLGNEVLPVAPGIIIDEIVSNIREISAKSSLSEDACRRVIEILTRHLRLLSLPEYADFLPEAIESIGGRDASDAPYLAAAMAVGADGIWSHDADFSSQRRFKVFSTKQLEKLIQ